MNTLLLIPNLLFHVIILAVTILLCFFVCVVEVFLNRQSRIPFSHTIKKGLKFIADNKDSFKDNDHDNTPESKYWDGNTKFGFDLLFTLIANKNGVNTSKNKNLIVSPLSITNIFSLVYAAAPEASQTGEEIAKTLYYPIKTVRDPFKLSQLIIDQGYKLVNSTNDNNINDDWGEKIQAPMMAMTWRRDKIKNAQVTLEMANRVYYSRDLKMNDEVQQLLHNDSFFQQCNFDCSGNEKRTLIDKMNQFIATNTHNRIQNMMNPDMIDQQTVAVLINVCSCTFIIIIMYLKHKNSKQHCIQILNPSFCFGFVLF